MDQLCTEISCQELERKLAQGQPVFLLDCRDPEEHNMVRIEGSTLVPMSELVDRQAEFAGLENHHTVVYCHHGVRSQRVAAWLREQGFSEVQSLAGGIDAWAEQIDLQMARY
jgi:rhodanese-related sulfurtransferase